MLPCYLKSLRKYLHRWNMIRIAVQVSWCWGRLDRLWVAISWRLWWSWISIWPRLYKKTTHQTVTDGFTRKTYSNLSNSNALEHSRNFLSATSPGMPITQKQHTCTMYMSIKSVLLNKKLPHKFVFKPVTTDWFFFLLTWYPEGVWPILLWFPAVWMTTDIFYFKDTFKISQRQKKLICAQFKIITNNTN